jgi:nucleoid-associated protein YgaU
MTIRHSLKLIGMLFLFSFLVSCATTTEGPTAEDAAAAIAAAKSANAKAAEENYEWRDTGKIIEQAEKAMKEGTYDEAVKLANKARRQAENAVNQKYSELERLGFGAAAPTAVSTAGESYEVVPGDNLWGISAKPSVYSDPYQWPLIYKANSDQIKDADLIYPGQVLMIDTAPSASDVDAAIQHAKTRGSWSLGVVEESDKAYLGR